MSRDLVAVGEVLLDVSAPALVWGRVVHAPVRVRAGGTPVNVAFAAAVLGASCAVVGRVGADPAGRAIRDALADAGVEALLAVDEELATGTFVEAGEGTVVTDRGASAGLRGEDIPPSLAAKAVLVSGYALLHDDSAEAARRALTHAEARWIAVTAGSAALVESRGPREVRALAQGANVLFANEAEAVALTGLAPREAAAELARLFEIACVTRGAAGAVASRGGEVAESGAPARVDESTPAGAGDAFAGVFLASLSSGVELEQALAAASGAALGMAR